MDEAQLARRAQAGDIDAYEALLRRYQPDAQRAAYFILRHKQEAEDAVQEAFVKAWHALDRFDSRRAFRPWLLTIVANEARDRKRSVHRRERLRLRAHQEAPTGRVSRSPEQQVVSDAELETLIDQIEQLPDTDQTILSYRYFLDLETREIAEALDMRHGTVRSRISRALAKLREQFAESTAEPERKGPARD